MTKKFNDGRWSRRIDVADFVYNNITPYEGDASFLQGPTERTKKLWEKCCDECRNNHYNAQTKAGRAFRRRVLSQLSSNYEILDRLVRAGMESLDLMDAVTMGFTPGIVTSYRRSGKHDEFSCFDIKYYMTRTRLFAISKIQNVSLPLQTGMEMNEQ